MKTLKEALFSRRNINSNSNPYGIKEEDLKGVIKDFPMGVVVRMWEESKKQDEKYTIEIFLKDSEYGCNGLFFWSNTEAGEDFWGPVIEDKDFDLFFERYPEYERYNLS